MGAFCGNKLLPFYYFILRGLSYKEQANLRCSHKFEKHKKLANSRKNLPHYFLLNHPTMNGMDGSIRMVLTTRKYMYKMKKMFCEFCEKRISFILITSNMF